MCECVCSFVCMTLQNTLLFSSSSSSLCAVKLAKYTIICLLYLCAYNIFLTSIIYKIVLTESLFLLITPISFGIFTHLTLYTAARSLFFASSFSYVKTVILHCICVCVFHTFQNKHNELMTHRLIHLVLNMTCLCAPNTLHD